MGNAQRDDLTKTRTEEKAANEAALADHDSFIATLKDGLKALRQFYAEKSASEFLLQAEENVEDQVAFVQEPADLSVSPYVGSKKTGGVMELLEQIQVDETKKRTSLKSEEDL